MNNPNWPLLSCVEWARGAKVLEVAAILIDTQFRQSTIDCRHKSLGADEIAARLEVW